MIQRGSGEGAASWIYLSEEMGFSLRGVIDTNGKYDAVRSLV